MHNSNELQVRNSDELSHLSTTALKQQILQLTQDRDTEPLNQKVRFFQNSLAPLVEELSQRNQYKQAQEQVALVPGVWSPVWSTIPFQDTLPGRLRDQSYQIFHADGYYANIARYAPGQKLPWLQKLASILVAYDLMLIQKFEIATGQWQIENVAIKQAVRIRAIPLSIGKADDWFTGAINSIANKSSVTNSIPKPQIKSLSRSTAKQFQTAFRATPQFEHLYIDQDFRLVKTQREAKQRPSYTIAVRKQ